MYFFGAHQNTGSCITLNRFTKQLSFRKSWKLFQKNGTILFRGQKINIGFRNKSSDTFKCLLQQTLTRSGQIQKLLWIFWSAFGPKSTPYPSGHDQCIMILIHRFPFLIFPSIDPFTIKSLHCRLRTD